MANTKVTSRVLADDAVGLAQLNISNDPSNGQALTYVASSNDLQWATISGGVAGISSSADATAITIDSSEQVGIGTTSPTKGNLVVSGAAYDSQLLIERTDTSSRWGLGGTTSGAFQIWDDNQGDASRFVINSSGFVGIGTTSPSSYNSYGDNLVVADSAHCGISIVAGTTSQSTLMFADGTGGTAGYRGRVGYDHNEDKMVFHTAAAERMRIKSDGEVCINNSFSGAHLHVKATGDSTSNWCQRYYTTASASTLYVVDFIDFEGQRNGFISANSTANTLTYNTSSDYRLKENVSYDWDATTRLKELKPARFNWIRDESNTLVDGFLAHEVEDIVPEAITGKKDATETKTNVVLNSYGNWIATDITEEEWIAGKENGSYDADTTWTASHEQNLYQGIDQAKLVPLLTKAIQEQQTIIDDLKARIETLESN